MELALAESQLGLAACDELLLSWNVWRFKICKFQELSKLKFKVQEIKLKAQALASTSTTTQATTAFQSPATSESGAVAA